MAGAGRLQPLAQMERGCFAGLELKIIEGKKNNKGEREGEEGEVNPVFGRGAMAAVLAVRHMTVLWRGAGQGGGCKRRLHDGEHQEFPAAEEHTKYQNARASGGEQGAGRERGGGGGGMQRAGNNRWGEQ